jgi:hypothetical protein
VSAKIPDPALVERQRRMRKLVGWIMAAALALLVAAGVCSVVRRPDEGPSARSIAAPEATVSPVVAPVAATAAPDPAPSVEAQSQAPAAPARSPAPAHRGKPAHKTRAPHAP